MNQQQKNKKCLPSSTFEERSKAARKSSNSRSKTLPSQKSCKKKSISRESTATTSSIKKKKPAMVVKKPQEQKGPAAVNIQKEEADTDFEEKQGAVTTMGTYEEMPSADELAPITAPATKSITSEPSASPSQKTDKSTGKDSDVKKNMFKEEDSDEFKMTEFVQIDAPVRPYNAEPDRELNSLRSQRKIKQMMKKSPSKEKR